MILADAPGPPRHHAGVRIPIIQVQVGLFGIALEQPSSAQGSD